MSDARELIRTVETIGPNGEKIVDRFYLKRVDGEEIVDQERTTFPRGQVVPVAIDVFIKTEPGRVGFVETVRCSSCGAKVEVEVRIVPGGEGFRASRFPDEWCVFDKYPPGDDGLGFACSSECLRAYFAER